MKVLIAGTGGIGARHARNVRAIEPDATFVAVRHEPNALTEELSMTTVPNLDKAIAHGADLAVISLPPFLHAETVSKLVDAGIPFYVEKPVAMFVRDIEDAARKAAETGLVTMVGCNLRMCPGFQKIRDIVSAATYGAARHARLSVGQYLPDWRPGRDYREVFSSSRAQGGGVLLELIHEFDLARFLFGEFSFVAAEAGISGALDMDAEDWGDVTLRNADMAVAVHLDCLDRAGTRQGRIVCDTGTIRFDTAAADLSVFDAKDKGWRSIFEDGDFDAAGALRAAMAHFIACTRNGSQTNQPFYEGVESLRLSERARRAAGVIT